MFVVQVHVIVLSTSLSVHMYLSLQFYQLRCREMLTCRQLLFKLNPATSLTCLTWTDVRLWATVTDLFGLFRFQLVFFQQLDVEVFEGFSERRVDLIVLLRQLQELRLHRWNQLQMKKNIRLYFNCAVDVNTVWLCFRLISNYWSHVAAHFSSGSDLFFLV